MNKKTCCGCFGLGCFLIVVAVVVGGYYGVNFLHESGREFAAEGLEKSVEKVTQMAFSDADRAEINQAASEAAKDIRSGKIGLVNLLTNATSQLETNLHVKAMLLAFYRQNKMGGEAGQGLPVDAENDQVVRRLIYGLTEKRIPIADISSITTLIFERYTETTGGEGKVKRTISLQRLKTGLSKEELQKSLDMMKNVVERNAIEAPAEDYDAAAAVKKDFLELFSKLKQGEKKDVDKKSQQQPNAAAEAELESKPAAGSGK